MVIKFIKKAVKSYPLITNMALCGSLYSGGNVSQQMIRGESHIDWKNTGRIGLIGVFFFGPFYTYWYRFLDKMIPGRAALSVVKKICADQCFGAPVCLTVFFMGTNMLEKKQNLLDQVKDRVIRSYRIGVIYWPVLQVFNFGFVPTHLRTAYVSGCAFIWTNILCYIKSLSDNKPADS